MATNSLVGSEGGFMVGESSDPESLCVLTVNTADEGGGAEAIAMSLALSYRALGVRSYMAVGYLQQNLEGLFSLAAYNNPGIWKRGWALLAARGPEVDKGSGTHATLPQFLGRCIAQPMRWMHRELGHEDFDFPSSWRLLTLAPECPSVLHLHNVHGGYFDLRALPWLSRQVPTVVTLHDAWMLSGHCAHSFDCERWRTGCGSCPDLNLLPRIKRDGTAYNWKRKRQLYRRSQIYLATPCEWLMSKVKQSILGPAILESRVIPNGIDTSVFRPADRAAVRLALGVPARAKVVLFAANGIRRNPWKDYSTIRKTFELLTHLMPRTDLLLIGLGEDAPSECVGSAEIRFVRYQKTPAVVAQYYQAADVYAHAANADTFPTTILEALACGTPVVATAIGGIPEQIKGMETDTAAIGGYGRDKATGVLVAFRDAQAIAVTIERLFADGELLSQLSENAARDARTRFARHRQVEAYLSWYKQILARSAASHPASDVETSQTVIL